MPDWKRWEGELLAGKHPLETCAGGDERSAVFVTRFASAKAAVRIRRAEAPQAAALAHRWNGLKHLRHPHLLHVHSAGVSELAGEPVAYLVMDYTEENLAETLRDRPLTADEAREMLLQAADGLAYLHGRGLTHGDLKTSNVLAIEETVKLSCESIIAGDPAADMPALGMTLIEALRQGAATNGDEGGDAAARLPAPFDEIARGCLNPDPALRWSAAQVRERLRPREDTRRPAPAPPPRAAKAERPRPGLRRLVLPAALAAVVLAVVVGVLTRRTERPSPVASARPPATAAVAPAPPPVAPPRTGRKSVAPAPPKPQTQSSSDRLVAENGIARRVLPNVPEKARNTITGRPAVVVRVTVDPAGNVTDAAVERTFSAYFSKLAVDAARKWQFVSAEGAGPREWILRFVFTGSDTQVLARKAGS